MCGIHALADYVVMGLGQQQQCRDSPATPPEQLPQRAPTTPSEGRSPDMMGKGQGCQGIL